MTVGPIHHESVRRSLLAGLVFLIAMIALQWSVGAYRGEQGIYSDDAAHFMNGLLIRDYVGEGLGRNPVSFAEEYYKSYPKIAPGMWPPLFHVILGLFLMPHWPPHAAALFLLAVFASWGAWRLYRIITLFSSRGLGVAAGLLFISTPVLVSLTTSIMLDAVVATFAIEAVYWLAVFTRTDHWRHAALFGLFTAMACLTKGNGISLVFAPAALILLTGRYDMLRRPGLYVAAAIVVVLAVPALVLTYRLDAAIGDFGPVTAPMVFSRFALYCGFIWTELGPAASVFAVIGIVAASIRGRRWPEDAPLPLAQVLTALVAGSFVFHLFNPHFHASGRYMTLAIAPLFGLIPVGVLVASRFIAGPARGQALHAALLGLIVVTTFFARPVLEMRKPFGYRDVVNHLQDHDSVAGKRLLIVSDEAGEGALVTDVAIRKIHPRPTIVRGSKLLATDNWNGHNFIARYSTAQAVIQELEDLHVDYLLLDSSPDAAVRLPYWGLIKEMVESHEDRLLVEYYNTVDTRNGPTRPLTLYRLRYQSPGPPKPLQIDLSHSVRQLLKR